MVAVLTWLLGNSGSFLGRCYAVTKVFWVHCCVVTWDYCVVTTILLYGFDNIIDCY